MGELTCTGDRLKFRNLHGKNCHYQEQTWIEIRMRKERPKTGTTKDFKKTANVIRCHIFCKVSATTQNKNENTMNIFIFLNNKQASISIDFATR